MTDMTNQRGKQLTTAEVRQALALRAQGESFAGIGRVLERDWRTVKRALVKYVGEELAESPVKDLALKPGEYDPQHALLDTLSAVELYKKKLKSKIALDHIPDVVSPRHLKELNDIEVSIIRLPSQIASQGRKDFYEQLAERNLEGSPDDIEELGKAGDITEAEYEELEQ